MKKIFLLTFLFLLSVNVYAAGTVTPSISKSRDNNSVSVTLSWTASSSDGALTAYDLTDATMYAISGYYLSSVYVDPGSTAPTAAYDIAINNSDSFDIMGGALADLSATVSTMLFPPTSSPQVIGQLTFVLTNNSVHSATGLVRLYFSRYPTSGTVSASIAGTVTANAGTNLNTSALALETGGNLAGAKTDLDDLKTLIGSATANRCDSTDTTAGYLICMTKQILYNQEHPTTIPGLATSALQGAGLPPALCNNALCIDSLTQDAAEGAAPTKPPVPAAMRADSTEPASIDDGDVGIPLTDLKKRQIVVLNSVFEMKASGNAALNATTENDIIAADATYKICITDITVYNSDQTNSEVVQVLDNGAIGTGVLMFYAAAPAGGGETHLMTSPRCTSAVNHKITVDSAGSANPVYISIGGFKTAE